MVYLTTMNPEGKELKKITKSKKNETTGTTKVSICFQKKFWHYYLRHQEGNTTYPGSGIRI
jgi:hypothetical protein